MSKKRIPPKTIFIACEGRNTEPIYFERIKEEIEEDNLYALTIYPDRTEDSHKSDPIGLIAEAQKNINSYDEVWVVYDKDGYTKHQEAFDKANVEINGKKVNIAFSSISFEHWILLHFEKNDTAYNKSKDIIDNKFLTNETYYPNYEKKSTIDIYPYVKSYTNQAIENAAWLRYKMKAALHLHPFYAVNPFSNVDILLKKLLNIQESVTFNAISELATLSYINIVFEAEGTTLKIYIRNNKDRSILLNEVKFYKNNEPANIAIPNKVIEPNTMVTVEISCDGVSELVVCYDKDKVVVVL